MTLTPKQTHILTSAEKDLIPLVEEIALVVLQNKPKDILSFLADYLENRDRGIIPPPELTPDPAIAAILSRLHESPPITEGNTAADTGTKPKPNGQVFLSANPQNLSKKSDNVLPKKTVVQEKDQNAQNYAKNPALPSASTGKLENEKVQTARAVMPKDTGHDKSDNHKTCRKVVMNLVEQMNTVDDYVSRVQQSLKSTLRQCELDLRSMPSESKTTIEQRVAQTADQVGSQSSTFAEGFGGYCPNPNFCNVQCSKFIGVLLGEIGICEAPFHAALVGWGLLALLFLLLKFCKNVAGHY